MFVHPSYLWALGFLAVPLLVHLLNFRRPRRVLFSRLSLLVESAAAIQRRQHLKRWLLLGIRLMACLVAVLLFAGLRLPHQPAAQQGGQSVVIVLDNSYSMQAADEHGPYLQQAVQLAQGFVQGYTEEDEILLTTTGDLPLAASFSNKAYALAELAKITASVRTASLAEVLRKLPAWLANSRKGPAQLIIISDFQQSTWVRDSLSVGELSGPAAALTLVPVGNKAPANLFASDLHLSPGHERTLTLGLQLHNTSTEPAPNVGIKLEINNLAVALTAQDIGARATQPAQLNFTPPAKGWLAGTLSVEDATTPFDNVRHFSLYVPEQIAIEVVGTEVAAQPMGKLLRTLPGVFTTHFTSPQQWATLDYKNLQLLVLYGIHEIPSGLIERIKQAVQQGMGLLLLPGEDANLVSYNALLARLGLGTLGALTEFNPAQSAGQPDLESYFYQGMFQPGNGKQVFDAPSYRKCYSYQPTTAQPSTNLLNVGRNQLLNLSSVGSGHVLVSTFLPEPSWTDFTLKTTFAPIFYRAFTLLGNPATQALAMELGVSTPLELASQGEGLPSLLDEAGHSFIPVEYAGGAGLRLGFAQLPLLPANYRLEQGGKLLRKLSFDLPTAESLLEPAQAKGLLASCQAAGLQAQWQHFTPLSATNAVQAARAGGAAWQYLVCLLLVLLLAELAVARLIR